MNNKNKKSIAKGCIKQYKRKSSIEISSVTVDILAKSAKILIYYQHNAYEGNNSML